MPFFVIGLMVRVRRKAPVDEGLDLPAQRLEQRCNRQGGSNERDVIVLLDHSSYEEVQAKVQTHEDKPKCHGQCTIH